MDTWQLYILAFNRRRTVYYYDGSDAEFPARRGWYVAEETDDEERPLILGH